MKSFHLSVVVVLQIFGLVPVSAEVVQTVGAGSAVSIIDRSATFDSLTINGILLADYSEDGIEIFAFGFSFQGFDAFNGGPTTAFHYEEGGNELYTVISAVRERTYALEFLIGHGQTLLPDANVVWETWRDGELTGSGAFAVAKGSIVGWCDSDGFDRLHVGAAGWEYLEFGSIQFIALDDLAVQIQPQPHCGSQDVIFADDFEAPP